MHAAHAADPVVRRLVAAGAMLDVTTRQGSLRSWQRSATHTNRVNDCYALINQMGGNMNSFNYRKVAVLCAVASVTALSVHAQETSLPGRAAEVEEIVVTGSRIARRESVSPIVTVGAQAIQDAGVPTMGDVFNRMPQVTATQGPGVQSTGTGAGSAKYNVNLRGLGGRRSLVLLDGRRMQPSDGFNTIDLNTLPPSIVEGVELVTGGASAVYGSDAMSGVVNFKLRKDLEGFEFNGNAGITEEGDSGTVDASVSYGTHFAGERGRVITSLSYATRESSRRKGRDFFDKSNPSTFAYGMLLLPNGTNLPSASVLNDIYSRHDPARAALTSPFVFSGTNPDGTLFQQAPGINLTAMATDPNFDIVPSFGAVRYQGDFEQLQAPLDRYSFFGYSDFEVSDAATIYGQVMYTKYKAKSNGPGGTIGTVPLIVPATNPFITPELREMMNSRPDPNGPLILVGSLMQGQQGHLGYFKTENESEVFQASFGAKGTLPFKDWTWDVNASYGETTDELKYGTLVDQARAQALLFAPDGGASQCSGGWDIFTYRLSDECKDYIRATASQTNDLDQKVVEAVMQGGLFDLPAGTVRLAIGADYRRNALTYTPSDSNIQQAATGGGSALGVDASVPSDGSTHVYEVYGELLVPVLSDLPLIKRLELGVGGRISDYDTIGRVNTYKGDLNWKMTESISLRGSTQRAIRAPSIGELYQGRTSAIGNIGQISQGGGDPCDISHSARQGPNAAQVREICLAEGLAPGIVDAWTYGGSAVRGSVGGNPDLTEETADTYNIGVVLQSPFSQPLIERLRLSIDYYNIKIEDAIGLLSPALVLQRCFNLDGASNPTYSPTEENCLLATRTPDGVLKIDTITVNLASYETSGIDFELDWGVSIGDLFKGARGDLLFNALLSKVNSYQIQASATAAKLDYAGTLGNEQIERFAIAHPKYKGIASLTYALEPVSVTLTARYIGSMENSNNVGLINGTQPGVSARTYFDTTARWRATDTLELQLGVINIADKYPPEWTGFGATDTATYDILGRRYFAGVRMTF